VGVVIPRDSAIIPDFSKLFEDFKEKRFIRLWRGSRDGFPIRMTFTGAATGTRTH
jgi:hypothetical protein